MNFSARRVGSVGMGAWVDGLARHSGIGGVTSAGIEWARCGTGGAGREEYYRKRVRLIYKMEISDKLRRNLY